MNGQSAVNYPGNRRVHVALAVADLERSRRFYETLLDVRPAKQRSGYVKFEPHDPSVNLALNEVNDVESVGRNVTHFGIQVKSAQAVQDAIARLSAAGLDTEVQEKTACCYAVQDKVWVTDPDGNRWEVFVVLEADVDQRADESSACCATGSTRISANC